MSNSRKISSGIKIPKLIFEKTTLPTSPVDGEIRHDVTDSKLKKYNNISMSWEPLGGGSGEIITIEIDQTAHGFAVLDVIRHNGTNWVKAQANSDSTLAQYIVTEVVSANKFKASNYGKIEITSHGLTVGEYYFLSETTAGGLTSTTPTSGYNQPVLYVENTNILHLMIQRGVSSELVSGAAITGTGSAGQIAIWFGTNSQLGDPNLTYNNTNKALINNGVEMIGLNSYTVLDNQTDANLFTFPKSYEFAILEYSISRGTARRVGRLMIVNDGTTASVSDDYNETAVCGISFSAVISGSNVQLRYTTTNTGDDGTFKVGYRRWS